TQDRNRQILLASRPVGAPVPENFRLVESPIPSPGPGQMLLRHIWMSLDPYMRGRMSDARSHAEPAAIDDVMPCGAVAGGVASTPRGADPGDLGMSHSAGWPDYCLSDASMVCRLDPRMPHPPQALGGRGRPGSTGYMGLLETGPPKPGATVVVAAATGPA